MPSLHLNVQQLKVLLEMFPPDEAYLRIQLIQTVFSHIVDLENMDIIVDQVLTADERNEVSFLSFFDFFVFFLRLCLRFFIELE
jgi:TRAP-type mannitol/chloroaromatic compound transport system permease large subunit